MKERNSMANKKAKPDTVYDPRLGYYTKVDLDEGAAVFTGTPKSIILSYLHWIKTSKKNLGKLTINNTVITIQSINNMQVRVNELVKRYNLGYSVKQIRKLNKIAKKHWDKFHTNNNITTT